MSAALPPGPRRPATLQTFAWIARPLPVLEECRRRYGDWFTVRLARVGTFVFVADPAAIKEIFTGDAQLLRAGQANAPLGPVVGSRSVLLLDGAEHLRQRRLMLPPFHGARMARYGELMAEITEAELDRWPLRHPFALRPRTQAITLEIILRVVFGVHDAARLDALRAALVALLAQSTSPATMLPWSAARPRATEPVAALPAPSRAGRCAHLRRDRATPRGPGARGPRRHPLPAAGRARRERRDAHRRRAAGRAGDAAGGGPRDDGHGAGVGVRAPAAPPGGAGAAHRRGTRRR